MIVSRIPIISPLFSLLRDLPGSLLWSEIGRVCAPFVAVDDGTLLTLQNIAAHFFRHVGLNSSMGAELNPVVPHLLRERSALEGH